MSAQEMLSDAPVPRLSHLMKWADFDGYGFNLHAEKSRNGQFIGKVDDDSPAQHAGLQEGDRIIEVNGVNIANENHRQVVERIKSIPNETKLLVIDEEGDRWYKEKKLVVKSTQSNVKYMKTPVPRPSADPPSYENISLPVNGVEKSSSALENGIGATKNSPVLDAPESVKTNGAAPHHHAEKMNSVEKIKEEVMTTKQRDSSEKEQSPKSNKLENNSPKTKEEVNSRSSTPMDGSVGSVPDSPHSTKSSRSSGEHSVGGNSSLNGPSSSPEVGGPGGLNLNMSASEMRQMLASRKKKDPKKVPMDIRQKFEIIQQM